jgi:DTW domain-containing protein YfiP
MARSVVFAGTRRCPDCQLNARWCICPGLETASTVTGVHVLMHRAEQWRPSSTGHLLIRCLPDASLHVFDPLAEIRRPGKLPAPERLWLLHPVGAPAERVLATEGTPEGILVIDGTWAQSGPMLKEARAWGSAVSLPDPGPSRYWLRSQVREGGTSSAEALACALRLVGDESAAETIMRQLELRVFAGLLSRGMPDKSESYLAGSRLRGRFDDLIQRLRGKALTSTTGTAEPGA